MLELTPSSPELPRADFPEEANNIRLRSFDGAHLTYPGMNAHIALMPHRDAAIWRVMCGGNALLAHAVGARKTFEMAAAGMKKRQAGLNQAVGQAGAPPHNSSP